MSKRKVAGLPLGDRRKGLGVGALERCSWPREEAACLSIQPGGGGPWKWCGVVAWAMSPARRELVLVLLLATPLLLLLLW